VGLLEWSEVVNKEKDRLLNVFVSWAASICESIRKRGYWADFFDPASGLLHATDGNIVWSEVHAMQVLRGHRLHLAGQCHVTLHPVFGPNVYPASLLIDAPEDVIVDIILNNNKP